MSIAETYLIFGSARTQSERSPPAPPFDYSYSAAHHLRRDSLAHEWPATEPLWE